MSVGAAVLAGGGLKAPAAAEPMRMDDAVWAPLENYMLVDEKYAQTT